MIVVDSSFLYALLDRRDAGHAAATEWYAGVDEDLSTTPLVLPEVDYMASTRIGDGARTAFRGDVAADVYAIEWWPSAAAESVAVAARYADLGVSLTDASLVALASRLESSRIATFDERHFRVMTPLGGAAAFTLLPRDA